MKKVLKTQSPAFVFPDVAGLFGKLQEQLLLVEKKLDIILSRLPERTVEVKSQPIARVPSVQQFQQFPRPQQNQQFQQRQGFNNRPLFKAVCADCHNDCEIPFRPTGDRPVYCKECFAKRKNSNQPKPPEAKPVPQPVVSQIVQKPKPQVQETKKTSDRKNKHAAKKRRK